MVTLNVTKVRSNVMLVLHNVTMESSNAKKKKKKKKRTTKCNKSTITYDVVIAQYDDRQM